MPISYHLIPCGLISHQAAPDFPRVNWLEVDSVRKVAESLKSCGPAQRPAVVLTGDGKSQEIWVVFHGFSHKFHDLVKVNQVVTLVNQLTIGKDCKQPQFRLTRAVTISWFIISSLYEVW